MDAEYTGGTPRMTLEAAIKSCLKRSKKHSELFYKTKRGKANFAPLWSG